MTSKFSLLTNVENQLRYAITQANMDSHPYPHWSLENVLPPEICEVLLQWHPHEKAISGDIQGKRENNNYNRIFITGQKQQEDARFAALALAFENQNTRNLLQELTGSNLNNTWVRLELCLDKEGFWLAPHTDIGAKKLTFLISLSIADDAETWGTDIITPEGKSIKRSSSKFNSGFLFIPGKNTWHGYEKRPMSGIRRTLIMNYVDSSWRARHELAFAL